MPAVEGENGMFTSLRVWLRMIDTSENYANAAEVGAAIAESGVPRAELFLADKVSFAHSYSASGVRATLAASLAALRTDYLEARQGGWLPSVFGCGALPLQRG